MTSTRRLARKSAPGHLKRLGRHELEDELGPRSPEPVKSGQVLTVGAADDVAEAAADRRADQALSRLSTGSRPGAQAHRHHPECDHLQRTAGVADSARIGLAGGDLDEATTAAIDAERSNGRRLAGPVLSRMQTAFDRDLSDVRVHTGRQSATLNRSVSARAFTTGKDIFFGSGEYAPDSPDGERVLAHELAHTEQQGGHGVQRETVHRLISKTQRDVEAVRSSIGLIKGANTEDSLHRLGKVLRKYHATKDPKARLVLIGIILGVCQKYLEKHSDASYVGGAGLANKKSEAKKVALVQDVFAEAQRDHSQAQAEAQYLGDAYGTSSPQAGEGGAAADTHFKKQSGGTGAGNISHAGAKALGSGTTGRGGGAGADSLKLVKEFGLTEAEILAVRTFTNADYRYINPATANSQGWMAAQTGGATKDEQKDHREEGTLHAGMMMKGLEKLPKKEGLVYRGMRLSQTEFNTVYGPTVTFNSFTSTSLTRRTAEAFAKSGTAKGRADQTVEVLVILTVTNARDVQGLSVLGNTEQEWLLLPGATFSRTKIEDDKSIGEGNPPSTASKIVYLTQKR